MRFACAARLSHRDASAPKSERLCALRKKKAFFFFLVKEEEGGGGRDASMIFATQITVPFFSLRRQFPFRLLRFPSLCLSLSWQHIAICSCLQSNLGQKKKNVFIFCARAFLLLFAFVCESTAKQRCPTAFLTDFQPPRKRRRFLATGAGTTLTKKKKKVTVAKDETERLIYIHIRFCESLIESCFSLFQFLFSFATNKERRTHTVTFFFFGFL